MEGTMPEKEMTIVVYPESGAPVRFDKCWGLHDDEETGEVTFSYRESVDQTFFVTFRRDSLIGIAVEV